MDGGYGRVEIDTIKKLPISGQPKPTIDLVQLEQWRNWAKETILEWNSGARIEED